VKCSVLNEHTIQPCGSSAPSIHYLSYSTYVYKYRTRCNNGISILKFGPCILICIENINVLAHQFTPTCFGASHAPSSRSSVWAYWIVAQCHEREAGWELYIVTVCVMLAIVMIASLCDGYDVACYIPTIILLENRQEYPSLIGIWQE
jgi:hypothetical protein